MNRRTPTQRSRVNDSMNSPAPPRLPRNRTIVVRLVFPLFLGPILLGAILLGGLVPAASTRGAQEKERASDAAKVRSAADRVGADSERLSPKVRNEVFERV